MVELTEMAERHGAILAELAQLGIGLARDLQARALAAEDAESAASLGLAFQRVARSLRQTLALEAKLSAELRRPEALARQLEEKNRAVRRRYDQVLAEVETRIEGGFEGDLREELLDELHERLGDGLLDEGFLDESVEDHIARLCQELYLDAPELRPPPEPESFGSDPFKPYPWATAEDPGQDPAHESTGDGAPPRTPAPAGPEPWRSSA